MEKNVLSYRQGDVLLVQRPVGAKAKATKRKGDLILAYGEVTGHCHRIKAKGVQVFEHEGTRWIRVPKAGKTKDGAELTHEEHGTVKVAPGEYEVVIQSEVTADQIRQVAD